MIRRLAVSGLVALMLWLAGCAHYRLGTGAGLAFEHLYIAPVENDTMLPQAVALVSTQVREAFIRDGRVALVATPAEADAVLEITLTRYGRTVATVQQRDTGLARKFDLTLDATLTLRDQRTGQALAENRSATSQREAFTDEHGQLQAEYQTLPLLASSLAENIAHAVLDVW